MCSALYGKRVVVTRPVHQSDDFSEALRAQGATALELPVIKVQPGRDRDLIRSVIADLASFDWVVFTSANGVKFFLDFLETESERDRLAGVRIAAIGPATAAALEASLRKPDVVPEEYISEAIAPVLGDVRNKKIMLARAVQARKVLAENLREGGAIVTELPLYDVYFNNDPELQSIVTSMQKPDFITFTSSSTVRAFHDLLKSCGKDWLHTVPAVCIGPVTARTLVEYGVKSCRTASVYTVQGMLDLLAESAFQ